MVVLPSKQPFIWLFYLTEQKTRDLFFIIIIYLFFFWTYTLFLIVIWV